jgi:hypothetical protein
MILPEFSNTETLIIELSIGLAVAIGLSVYFGKKQNSILKRIQELSEEQSKLIDIMESRRRERIRWFKHHSLGVLNSVKKQYEMLSAAVDKYESDRTEENRKKIEIIASTSLQIPVHHAQDLIINREIPNTTEYIENPWIIAKLADSLSLIGKGFAAAKRSPTDIANIRQSIELTVMDLNFAIDQISNERD